MIGPAAEVEGRIGGLVENLGYDVGMGMPSRPTLAGTLQGFLGRLRYPQLFLLAGGLFLADLILPDVIPFVDEIFLGVVTLLASQWKKRRDEAGPEHKPPAKNVTPDS